MEQPTAVVEEGEKGGQDKQEEQGEEKCRIYHFSSPFSMPAKNVLLGLGRL